MAPLVRLYSFPVVDLGHTPHSPTPQTRVLVAVSPAVNRALNQPTLAAQAGVQLGERPANCVALSLVVKAVSLVLILVTARAGVYAVLGLEFLRELIDVYRLDVASDGVLHLHAVSRVLEGDPLDAILVLSDDERSCGGNRAGCRVRVDARAATGSGVHAASAAGRSGGGSLRGAQIRGWSLQWGLVELRPWAAGQAGSVRVCRRVLHGLRLLMGHQRHAGLDRSLLLLRRIWRRLLQMVRLIVDVGRHLRRRLAVQRTAMLIMLRRLDRRWRIGLRSVVDWRELPVHGCGGHGEF